MCLQTTVFTENLPKTLDSYFANVRCHNQCSQQFIYIEHLVLCWGTRVKAQDFILYKCKDLLMIFFNFYTLSYTSVLELGQTQSSKLLTTFPIMHTLQDQVANTTGLNQKKKSLGKNLLNFFLFFFSHKGKPYHSALI